ncbi:superoxide dismutase [Candidatus Uhrbacteria bacterium RIFCSPLOWO2_01_FULL_47_24]|uniref:superoxide dismutase n=1 Tax=Candidatus Uhrbacteria bacterium RIFCSPLOWO2_01_FULL_47_24 TaxID=1802401 RepID=A0A1F7USN6_9BACT|nr:MAG: superoxide dismutase [Candidatus Uhrbacteria bacterium RIFCSPHIGHO2_01_FULL_47_11]OGL68871.1 MAG: superoxide dismutase [Candidatus Uhrbacteria bacterium RIFCSPHIGHO2_02_FULL_46_47]OGL75268.1 MAG: superoxide dismutase [Candidatus Uhrbacteria bacterium RIFCSPHIGHO2_12_FULL_47_11]OGL81265.1 MAG: superoxide dismutase [Candidatus Uhrbacteria bacterium RIFCSPLOWO2_01_FULL_47_24]OGL85153.1 MAG: superoxide dismutase [Candidatus Uhrbacteria bacterium RIFCSPLOWO2_02_FULL_46_25]OGL92838.1 MAG: su
MPYEAKNFDHLLGMLGFSEVMLKNHFTLYQGYVKNFNLLNDTLVALEKEGKFGAPEFAEMNRRFGWEFNGMRLHELYFGNMRHANSAPKGNANAPMRMSNPLGEAITREWGSQEMWEKDFKAMGAMRGIGWTILYHEPEANRLFNVWVNEHDMGHFAGCTPLLVLDVFEHAYMLDYGLKRADYIEAFFNAIDWRVVSARLKR